jgi:tRNA nucleotidyltransferase (CCA-adding enzyme)
MVKRIPVNTLETRLLETVSRRGGEVYLVGGAVRDALLGYPSKDADYLVTGVSFADLRTDLETWARVDVVGASFGVLKLTRDAETVDVALPRTERSTGVHHRDFEVTYDSSLGVEIDLMRRDLTINAMARRLSDGALIDPFDGEYDLRTRVLRAVGDATERFNEDPLRMLRLARFMAKLEFTPEPATQEAARALAPLVSSVAPERVQTELWGLLAAGSADGVLSALRFLRDTGLLERCIPEFGACIGFDQRNPHHHLTLDEHIFQAVHHAASRGASVRTRLALLLHDIGKPDTQSFGADGIAHYYHHEARSADLARVTLERLKFSNDVMDSAVKLVANHMRPPRDATLKTLRRFKRDLDDLWRDALEVRLADRLAHAPEPFDPFAEFQRCTDTLAHLPVELEGFDERQLAISGAELMRVFDLAPGHAIGKLKKRATQAVIDGELENEPSAILEWLKKSVSHGSGVTGHENDDSTPRDKPVTSDS